MKVCFGRFNSLTWSQHFGKGSCTQLPTLQGHTSHYYCSYLRTRLQRLPCQRACEVVWILWITTWELTNGRSLGYLSPTTVSNINFQGRRVLTHSFPKPLASPCKLSYVWWKFGEISCLMMSCYQSYPIIVLTHEIPELCHMVVS